MNFLLLAPINKHRGMEQQWSPGITELICHMKQYQLSEVELQMNEL